MKYLAAALCGAVLAAPAVARPVDEKRVNDAIEKAMKFLKSGQNGGAADSGGEHALGLQTLVGLAMLEGGVAPTDPVMTALVGHVRTRMYREGECYNISLGAIFLDRINDPVDIPLIQLLGARLLAGQSPAGGWGYRIWSNFDDEARLRAAMQPRDVTSVQSKPQPDANAPPGPKPKLHPEVEKLVKAVREGYRSSLGEGDDNSNTQFGIVALWVCQRRGVPCYTAFKRVENRFVRSQSPRDYGWGYQPGDGGSGPSMTCAGLIGLAAASASKPDPKPEPPKPVGPPKEKRPEDEDGFYNPPATGGGEDPDIVAQREMEEEKKEDFSPRDNAIKMGLIAIGKLLKGQGLGGGTGGDTGWGGVSDLYFMWSLERVGVAYGLETIGDVDWYQWGAERILATQQADGSFQGNYSVQAATSFAVLFLKKTNFVSDLSKAIKGKVKDPGEAQMRGSRGNPLNAGGNRDAVRKIDEAAPTGPLPPGVTAVGVNPSEAVAEELTNAADKEWLARLRTAKENKGGQYTVGLALAVGRLDGKRQYQAREALAERLTRMTSLTLKRMLGDRDSEIRRAAALAIGMKEDRERLRDLIMSLSDIDESVIRAAKTSLKAMTDQNFGPAPRATEEEKYKAIDTWLIWFASEGRGK